MGHFAGEKMNVNAILKIKLCMKLVFCFCTLSKGRFMVSTCPHVCFYSYYTYDKDSVLLS